MEKMDVNAGNTIPKNKARRDKPGISQHLEDLIKDRLNAVERMDIDPKLINLVKQLYKKRNSK